MVYTCSVRYSAQSRSGHRQTLWVCATTVPPYTVQKELRHLQILASEEGSQDQCPSHAEGGLSSSSPSHLHWSTSVPLNAVLRPAALLSPLVFSVPKCSHIGQASSTLHSSTLALGLEGLSPAS